MVDVIQRPANELQTWAGKLIPRLILYWRELPGIANEIDDWDDGEALTYIEEWRHYESQRIDLERVSALSVLTDEQNAQLTELRELVAVHKPTLDRLLRV